MRRAGLYGLFLLSGVSALVYELAWQRLLVLVFGVSTLSVSAVLAAFMGGLAVGGLLLGRRADRTRRPLRWYAGLELLIGVGSLLVPPGFAVLTTAYTWLYGRLDLGPVGGACLRFGMALVILGPLTTLMGATVPVMGRLVLRRGANPGPAVSWFYAANTLGGVAGAALTGLVLLRFAGLRQALWLAAGLNLVVALIAGLGSRREETPQMAQDSPAPTPTPVPWFALACAAVTGAAGLGLEVVWARVLGILTSNSAYGFALIITVLLTGLSLGSAVQGWWARRAGNPWRRLAVCQWLLALITLGTVPWFRTAPAWLDHWCNGGSVGAVFLGELALTAGALLAPAVCMGLSLPLLMAAVAGDARRFGRRLGRLYAVNSLAGAAGAFLAGFVLIPRLGIRGTFAVIIGGGVLVGAAAWVRAGGPAGRARRLLGGAVVPLGVLVGWMLLPAGVYLKDEVQDPRHLLYYCEGNNATVAVVEECDGVRSVMVDSQPVAGTAGASVVDQKMLAHLPLLLHPDPHRALTVGFGSGGTSHSMTLHGVAVDCVEIEATVPAAADWFRSENDGVLTHPNFRLILDDARSWLRVAPVAYDVIVTDCTNIQYRSNGDLYTVDYFRLMQQRLSPDGLAAAWVPANGIRATDLNTLLRSFRTVFPHTSVWFMNVLATDFLTVVGTPGPLAIDLEQLRQRVRRPGVREDLAAVGLADPCRLIYTLLTAGDELDRYLGAGPLNTDDRPVLSYSTYGHTFEPTVAGNLVRLLACRVDVARYVTHPAPAATMLRHYAASNEAILGHIAHQVGSETGALAQYVAGAKLLPEDPAFRELVGSTYLRLQRQ